MDTAGEGGVSMDPTELHLRGEPELHLRGEPELRRRAEPADRFVTGRHERPRASDPHELRRRSEPPVPPSVLVVDDESSLRRVYREILQPFGVVVLEAANGEEALEVLQRDDAPVLLLVDVVMPVMDGITFLRERVRQRLAPHARVLLLSYDPERVGTAPAVDAFLRKPVGLDPLLDALTQLLVPAVAAAMTPTTRV